jgi:hypothetical protein
MPEYEDRGTPIGVWIQDVGFVDESGWDVGFVDESGWCDSFHTFGRTDSDAAYVISVPIGWTFKPHPYHGVVLQSTFRVQLTAEQALSKAYAREDGFQLVSC